jgi:hypothetical protein
VVRSAGVYPQGGGRPCWAVTAGGGIFAWPLVPLCPMLVAAPARQLRRIHFVPAQRKDAHTVAAQDLHGLILLNDPPQVLLGPT